MVSPRMNQPLPASSLPGLFGRRAFSLIEMLTVMPLLSLRNLPTAFSRVLRAAMNAAFPAGTPEYLRRGILLFAGLGLLAGLARAEENLIDFESLSPELPGWTATVTDASNQPEYRVAAKWDTPFGFSLDNDKPHSGSTSLKCEFTGEVPGVFSFGPPVLSGSGMVEVRFFVRSEGFAEEGVASFGEYDAGGKRIASRWAGTKVPLNPDWQEVSWTGQLNPAASGVRMRIIFKSVPVGAKLWIDDLSVKTVEN